MTIYEQIQQAVDFIEDHLHEKLPTRRVAEAAFMSLRSLHNHFPAVTGISCGEYVIRRRLAEAVCSLRSTDMTVLQAALNSGYESHEAFSRAITKEFGASPRELRGWARPPAFLERLALVKEMYMGVLLKKLADYRVMIFDAFGENCEFAAMTMKDRWIKANDESLGPHRIFGHNIDASGNLCGADYAGYRFMVTLPEHWSGDSDAILVGGHFVVTGIEGSFEDDPDGSWVSAGWERLMTMMKDKGLSGHSSGRWLEEHLDPVTPGRTRMDLSLEIE